MLSLHGGKQISFGNDLTLQDPEFLVFGTELRITGYQKTDDNLFKIQSVEVVFRKPKEAK